MLIGILLLVPFFGTSQPAEKACFSVPGGFYGDSFTLEIFPFYQQHHIRYTINGNCPTATSRLYTEPLLLDESLYSSSDIYTIQVSPSDIAFVPDSIQHCIVIRAAVFDQNENCISETATNSYFIRSLGCDTHDLPVISICADTLDLFDYNRGIMVPGVNWDSLNPNLSGNYYQKGLEWERTINVEYYHQGDSESLNQVCGLRTHGNQARRRPQKGFKIYAREEYGKKRFDCRFFETTPRNSFKHLLIKPFSVLYPYLGVQDYVCSQMAISIGLEAGHSRPVCLYLNGEYWGIYFLQERMDERYLEDCFGVDIEQCNIVSNWKELDCGRIEPFNAMMQWLETASLDQESDYQYINEIVDVDNFIDYIILETFVANNDWPANNIRCWQVEGGKWRWMFFDGDATFNPYSLDPFANPIDLDVFGNATYAGNYTWPSSRKATLLFRKLLENSGFRARFENRLLELCHSDFSYDKVSQIYFNVIHQIEPEIEKQSFRFDNPPNLKLWNWAQTIPDDFLLTRAETYYQEWLNYFCINDTATEKPISCYPNPFTQTIQVSLNAQTAFCDELVICDLLGRIVFAQPCSFEKGENHIVLQPNFVPGMYVLKVNNHRQRIVKY